MSYSDIDAEDEFYRWFVGGSPPEADAWPRDAFESALQHGPFIVAVSQEAGAESARSAT